MTYIKASLPDKKESFIIAFSDPVSKNISVSIYRNVRFKKGRYPTTKKIITGLTKKYGTPSASPRSGLLWLINQNDNVNNNIDRGMGSRCFNLLLGRGGLRPDRFVELEQRSTCGLVIQAVTGTSDIARGFIIRLADARLIANNKARTQKYLADQKAAEAQKRKDKASKVKVDTDF